MRKLEMGEIDIAGYRDAMTTIVLIHRGLVDDWSPDSHHEGCEGSFDTLARLVSR